MPPHAGFAEATARPTNFDIVLNDVASFITLECDGPVDHHIPRRNSCHGAPHVPGFILSYDHFGLL
jgi:hypothetical protein